MTGRASVNRVQRPSQHVGYVQHIATGGYFAVCPSCGMLPTPNRVLQSEAMRDIEQHVEEITASYIKATQ